MIPEDFAFRGIPGISREIQEKLDSGATRNSGPSWADPGVTPAAVAVLETYLRLSHD